MKEDEKLNEDINRRIAKWAKKKEELAKKKKALTCPYCQAHFKDKKTKKAMLHLRDCAMKDTSQKKLTSFFVVG